MTDKPLSIEERLEQAVLELEPSLMCENSYAKDILRRHFGDLGARPDLMPSCHICGWPMKGVCESCGATTGVAPAESRPPRTATSSNQRLGYLEPDAPSDPLCRVEGCGKPRSDKIHYPFPFYSEHNFDNTTERRIGVKEKRKHEEELNPAGNRFRMKWWNWWESAHINIRTGPPDRRNKRDINATTWYWCGIHHRFVPCPECAQPGKKEGESTDAPSTVLPLRNVQDHGESTARAAGTSVTSAAPLRRIHATIEHSSMTEPFGDLAEHLQDCCGGCLYCHELCQKAVDEVAAEPAPQVTAPQVTAEAVKAYRHRLMQRDNATETAALSSWSDAEVAAFASSLLAERDRTIAELRAKSEHYRVEAINQGCKRGEQAEQELGAREKDLCRTINILQSISHPSGVSRFEDAMHAIRELQDCYLTAKGKTNRLEATAERLRGLLREWYLHYLNNGEWDELPLALRQRIKF